MEMQKMTMSRDAKLMAGITILVVPTIMYGGWTLLGILTQGTLGPASAGLKLTDTQWALWRAGHAHGGEWRVFSIVLQVLLDSTRLTDAMVWLARICGPISAV